MSLARLSAVVALCGTCMLAHSTKPLAAQSEPEARGFVHGIARTVYETAWTTATYESVRINDMQWRPGGWDITVRLFGRSRYPLLEPPPLWLDLVVMLRDGRLHDIRVLGHNAVMVEPFTVLKTLAEVVESIAGGSAERGLRFVDLEIRNDCPKAVRVGLSYLNDRGAWVTQHWWSFEPGQRYFLTYDRARIKVPADIFVFAESDDGTTTWAGEPLGRRSLMRRIDGRTYWLRPLVLNDSPAGHRYTRLTCPSG